MPDLAIPPERSHATARGVPQRPEEAKILPSRVHDAHMKPEECQEPFHGFEIGPLLRRAAETAATVVGASAPEITGSGPAELAATHAQHGALQARVEPHHWAEA